MSVVTDYMAHQEAMTHFEAYCVLKGNLPFGVALWPEARVPSDLHRSGYMRVDLALVVEGFGVIAVIEVKKAGKKMSPNCRQARAYKALARDYGIQIYFLSGLDDIAALIARIQLSLKTILPGLSGVDSDKSGKDVTGWARANVSPGQVGEGQHAAAE